MRSFASTIPLSISIFLLALLPMRSTAAPTHGVMQVASPSHMAMRGDDRPPQPPISLQSAITTPDGWFFAENQGQYGDLNGRPLSDVRYVLHAGGMRVFVRTTGLTFVMTTHPGLASIHDDPSEEEVRRLRLTNPDMFKVTLERTDVDFIGVNPFMRMHGEAATSWPVRMYTGVLPKGTEALTAFRGLVCEDVYPGIDFVMHITAAGLKYEFVVHPTGNMQDIRMQYSGNMKPALDGSGRLVSRGETFSMTDDAPKCTIDRGEGKASTEGRFVVEGQTVRFEVPGATPGSSVVIDPTISWATYIGSNGADNAGGVDIDVNGDVVMVGSTDGTNFPVSSGAFQTSPSAANWDGYIIRFSNSGSRVWGTYFAGCDVATGPAADGTGAIYFTGSTSYANFPVTTGAFQSTKASTYDGIVVKLRQNGTLAWATFYGGNGNDVGMGLVCNPSAGLYVTGETESSNFPVTTGAFQTTYNGGAGDAFLLKMDTSGAQTWCTYVGSSSENWGHGVTFDNAGYVIIIGTTGTGFPVTSGCLQFTYPGGSSSAFVAKFSPLGVRQWATYFGSYTTGYDLGCINADIVISGITSSGGSIPVTPGAFQTSYQGGANDSWVARLGSAGNSAMWATYLGGNGDDHTTSLHLTQDGRIMVSGCTFSTNFPVTPGAWQTVYGGNEDRFIVQFNYSGIRCWATYMGGNLTEKCWNPPPVGYRTEHGITIGPAGEFFACGYTAGNFPVTTGAFQGSFSGGGNDNYLVRFVNDCSGLLVANAGNDTTICRGSSAIIGLTGSVSACYSPLTYSWSPATGLSSTNVAQPTATPTVTTTYIQTVTDQNNCSKSDTMTVTVTNLGAAITPTTGSICGSGSILLSANTGTGLLYQWIRNGVAISGAVSATYNATQTGTYRVRISTASGCFDTSNTAIITIAPGPGATITPSGPTTFCSGGSVTFTANTGTGLTYVWQRNLANISGAVNSSYTATTAGSYRVIVTNTNGCSDTSLAINVTISPSPGATITASGPTTFCQGGSVVLTANTGTGLTYVWMNPNSPISGATNSTYTATVSGSYRVVVTNAAGCKDTSNIINVTVSPRPGATITASGPTSFCDGGSVLLTANSGTGLTYVWQVNSSTIPGATGMSYTATGAGAYRVLVSNAAGCTDTSATITVTLLPKPVFTMTSTQPTTICQGDSVVMTAAPTTGITFQWQRDGSNITGATGARFVALISGTYRVIGTGSNGCTDTSVAVQVTVLPRPVATLAAAGPTTFCQGQSVLLQASTNTGYVYQWQLNGVLIPGAANSYYYANTTGTYRVIITTALSCVDTSAGITITVLPKPTATVTPAGPTSFCDGGSVVLNAGTGTGWSYVWQQGGSNITGATNPSYTATTAGQYRVIVTNTQGCSDTSAAVTVTVYPRPGASITGGPTTICQGQSVVLQANTGTGFTYVWQNNSVTIPGATGANYAANANGVYRVIVTSAQGCSDTSSTVTVTVLPKPSVTIAAAGPTSFCDGGSVVINASGTAGVTFQWQHGGNNIPGATASSYTATLNGAYRVIATAPNGCSDTSAVVMVTVYPRPGATITGSPLDACEGGSVLLTANSGTNYIYAWLKNSVQIGGAAASTYRASTTGAYQVIVRNPQGCQDTSAAVTVTIHPKPSVTQAPLGPTTFCEGASVDLQATSPTGTTYGWIRDGGRIAGASGSIYNAIQSGAYRAIVWDQFGCSDTSAVINVTVYPRPKVIVTPPGPVSFCIGGSAELIASVQTSSTYEWQHDGTTISGATGARYTATLEGRYRVIAKSPNGCIDTSAEVEVSVNTQPTQRIEGKTSVCPNTIANYFISDTAGFQFTWFVANGTILGGQSTPTVEIQWGTAGAGQVSVHISNGGACTRDTVLNVTITTSLTPIISGKQSVCEGDTITLDAGAGYLSYDWRFNGSSLGITTQKLRVTATGIYTVVVTDPGGCSGTSPEFYVQISPIPTVVLNPEGPTLVCTGDVVKFTAFISPDGTFTWLRDGKVILGASGTTFTATQPGKYQVIGTSNAGCTSKSGVIDVVIKDRPVADLTALGATTLCAGGSVTLKAQPTTGVVYTWLKDGSTIPGATSGTLTATQSGTYQVIVADAATNCSDTSLTVKVNVRPTMTANISGATQFCSGESTTLTVTGSDGTCQWSSGETTRSIVVTQPGQYEVTLTDTSGCKVIAKVTINAFPRVAPLIKGSRTICPGGQTTLDAQAGYVTYRWSTGESTRMITARTAGMFAVEVTDSNGCSGRDTVIVTESTQLSPTISGPTAICSGATVTLAADSNDSYQTYIWSTVADTTTHLAVTRTFQTNAPGSYMVRVVDQGGCAGNAIITVARAADVNLQIVGRAIICSGQPADTLDAGPGFVTYKWSNGATTQQTIVANAGTYTVTVTDTNGCTWNASLQVRTRTVTPTISGSSSFCSGSVARLSAVWPGATAWRWSTGATTQNVNIGTAGVVWVEVTDSTGCTAIVYDTLRESSTLTLNVGGTRSFCQGASTTLDAGPDMLWYRWSGLDTSAVLSRNRTISLTQGGVYVIRVADSTGCEGIDSVLVTVDPKPLATISGDTLICSGDSTTLSVTPGFALYAWSTGATGTSIVVKTAGSYWVRVENSAGCDDTVHVIVKKVGDTPLSISGLASICTGAADTLDAGGGFIQYAWSRYPDTTTVLGASRQLVVTQSGRYKVSVVSSAGCSGTGTFDVTVNATPTPVVTRVGNTLTSTPSVTYQWMLNGTDIAGETSRNLSVTQSGSYRVRVVDANGCTGISDPIDITLSAMSTEIALACPPAGLVPVGSVVSVPVQLTQVFNAMPGVAQKFSAVISTNPRVLYPRFTYAQSAMNGRRLMTRVDGTRSDGFTSGTLADLPFEVLWGDTACAIVRIDSVYWSDGTPAALGATECVICAQLCEQGGTRLFNAEGRLSLLQNRPNPFNAATIIEYEVIEHGMTDLSVYDMMGRRVATLLHDAVLPGRYVVRFDASTLASGLYTCMLITPSEHRSILLEVMK